MREPIRDKNRLEHIIEAHLLEAIDWDEWSKTENGNIGITGN